MSHTLTVKLEISNVFLLFAFMGSCMYAAHGIEDRDLVRCVIGGPALCVGNRVGFQNLWLQKDLRIFGFEISLTGGSCQPS